MSDVEPVEMDTKRDGESKSGDRHDNHLHKSRQASLSSQVRKSNHRGRGRGRVSTTTGRKSSSGRGGIPIGQDKYDRDSLRMIWLKRKLMAKRPSGTIDLDSYHDPEPILPTAKYRAKFFILQDTVKYPALNTVKTKKGIGKMSDSEIDQKMSKMSRAVKSLTDNAKRTLEDSDGLDGKNEEDALEITTSVSSNILLNSFVDLVPWMKNYVNSRTPFVVISQHSTLSFEEEHAIRQYNPRLMEVARLISQKGIVNARLLHRMKHRSRRSTGIDVDSELIEVRPPRVLFPQRSTIKNEFVACLSVRAKWIIQHHPYLVVVLGTRKCTIMTLMSTVAFLAGDWASPDAEATSLHFSSDDAIACKKHIIDLITQMKEVVYDGHRECESQSTLLSVAEISHLDGYRKYLLNIYDETRKRCEQNIRDKFILHNPGFVALERIFDTVDSKDDLTDRKNMKEERIMYRKLKKDLHRKIQLALSNVKCTYSAAGLDYSKEAVIVKTDMGDSNKERSSESTFVCTLDSVTGESLLTSTSIIDSTPVTASTLHSSTSNNT